MSDFDEYIKNKYPSDYLLMKVRYPNQELSELYSDQFEVWQHQQAIIDNLKAQLNNMEACYIEKKKQVEELRGQIDEALQEVKGLERFTGEDCIADFDVLQGAVSHACKRLEKTLRGES